MKTILVFLLLAAAAHAQFSDARSLSGKPPCSATVTTNCIPSANAQGKITAAGVIMPDGTPLEIGGACMAATAVTTPAVGEHALFLNEDNSCHLSSMDSARAVVDLQATASGGKQFVFSTNAQATIGASTTHYFSNAAASGVTLNTSRTVFVMMTGEAAKLRVALNGTQSSTGSLVCTLQTGATLASLADTAVTFTVAANDVVSYATPKTDIVHTAAVTEGDVMVLKCVNNATAASVAIREFSWEVREVH